MAALEMPASNSSRSKFSRRAFARAITVALAGSAAAAALPAEHGERGAHQSAAPASGTTADAEVDSQLARVLALYGDRLTAAQKQRLRGIIAGHVAMLQPVRAVAMRNSDAPQTALRLVGGAR